MINLDTELFFFGCWGSTGQLPLDAPRHRGESLPVRRVLPDMSEQLTWADYLDMQPLTKEQRARIDELVALVGLPPRATHSYDNGLSLCFDVNQHHLEFEVTESGDFEWFYRDRTAPNTNSGEGTEDTITEIPPRVHELIALIKGAQ